MRKPLFALVVAVPLLFPPPTLAAPTTGDDCNEPVPERTYTDDQLVYRLAVDLTRCDWWDGSPIQLEADLERLDGSGGHGAWSGTLCGAVSAIGPDNGEESTTEVTASPRSGICEVQVDIEHPPVEAAYYRGEVSFPWDGGRRSLSFAALCGQATGCLDLPVDAMPTLAPIGEMIVGDGDRPRPAEWWE